MRSTALRCLAVLVALALLAAACGGGAPDEEVDLEGAVEELQRLVDEVGEQAEEQFGARTPSPPQPAGPPDEEPVDPAQAPPPAIDVEEPAPDDAPEAAALPDDRAGVGAMCRHYLRPDVPRLVVEVAAQSGAAPAPASLDHLAGVLGSVLDKPAGIEVVSGATIPGGARTWSVDDLRATAASHRTHGSSPESLGMFVLALRGEFEEPDVLGLVFSATELAIFPDGIGALPLLGDRGPVERAVLVHEAGHLLCLVNIGYTSEVDHEHPEHPHHSKDEASVMHWAIETSAVAQVFSGPPPDDFTATDRADLEGLRTGRY